MQLGKELRSAMVTAAVVLAACGQGGDGAPPDLDDLPPAPFGLSLAAIFGPPPDGGFWEPAGVAVREQGPLTGVWVVDRKANHVHRYQLDGRYQGRIARPGGGPGELAGGLALGFAGDTLWVYSAGNRRIDFFGAAGQPLATQPLPDGVGSVIDMIAVGKDFVASTVFDSAPLVRFRRGPGGGVVAAPFGRALAEVEARLATGRVPSIYRVALVGGRIWALHLYLPLVGIFDPGGTLLRTVVYPSNPVAGGAERVGEIDGVRRRVQEAPAEPGGAIGVMEGSGGEVYLLTHQRSGDRQRLYVLSESGDLLGRAESPLDGWMAVSAGAGSAARYVLATWGEAEEPTLLRLKVEP